MIWLADAKYYRHQLKVNLAFHRPSKSKGDMRQFAWDSSPVYLFVFPSIPPSLQLLLESRGGGGAITLSVDTTRLLKLNSFLQSLTLHADKPSPTLHLKVYRIVLLHRFTRDQIL